jgi:hypothetical protein
MEAGEERLGIGAKLIVAAALILAVLLLMRVLSPNKGCPNGQVPVSTIAGTACMPRDG